MVAIYTSGSGRCFCEQPENNTFRLLNTVFLNRYNIFYDYVYIVLGKSIKFGALAILFAMFSQRITKLSLNFPPWVHKTAFNEKF